MPAPSVLPLADARALADRLRIAFTDLAQGKRCSPHRRWGDRPETVAAGLAERGRGLLIVEALTGGAWGYRVPGDGTKIAWIAIPKYTPGVPSVGPRLT
ncbi:hypothetical protein ACWGI9_32925 [Streptomyces sp. NPDC054833]